MFQDRDLADQAPFSDSDWVFRMKPLAVIGEPSRASEVRDDLFGHLPAAPLIYGNFCDGLNACLEQADSLAAVVFLADSIGGLIQAKRGVRFIERSGLTLRSVIVTSEQPCQRFNRHLEGKGPLVLQTPVSPLALRLSLDWILREAMVQV